MMREEQASHLAKTTATASDNEVLHWLNQRYKEQFDRAERLQAELTNIQGSKVFRVLCWLRRLRANLSSQSKNDRRPPRKRPKVLDLPNCKATGTVSIIIPFRNRGWLLRNLLTSLRQTTYRDYEVILIDNGSTCSQLQRMLRRLQQKKRYRVVTSPGKFNFSHLSNKGAKIARGNYLLFLNNDTEVVAPEWLEQLLLLAQTPGVGAAGATLLYPNGTIQHAGIFPDSTGVWTHVYRGRPAELPGDHGELRLVREVPAVTGACLMIRRGFFQKVGGFSPAFPITGNDVDLCCRIRERGLIVGITPHSRLLHYESLTRGYALEHSVKNLC